jgi:RNA polymerase sigma-70 factor (ECF subfamily)
VDAFFAAAHDGDFDALVAVLDPDVVLRSDGGELRRAATGVRRGAAEVARSILAVARRSVPKHPVLINGAAGVLIVHGGRPAALMAFTVVDGKVVAIDSILDPERLARLDLAGLDG